MFHESVPRHHSWGRWKLPKAFGIVNNDFACCYLAVLLVFNCFPATVTVVPENMNYAVLVFGATVLFSIIWYVLVAKTTYVGPIREIKLEGMEKA